MICRDCGREFELRPDKPGFINQCRSCAEEMGEEERLGGNMIWSHKTAPEIEIKSGSEAKAFARKQRRFGAGVTCCLTQSKVQAHKGLMGYSPMEKERDDEFTEKERKLS